ncbi:MAG: restriction endonuclease [Patescibacteria group bacterium]|nr:restriction endonuclease [Patescibacteria group bacterium]
MPIIIKGNGEREAFDTEKLQRSLQHVGADEALAKEVADEIARGIRDGMTTTEIYRQAFSLLHKREHVVAARYSMRRAILELGPTGFPFEKFVAELFKARGYETEHNVIVKGRCAEHEVDVIMRSQKHVIGAELKFHNTPGFKTDLKTALYVRARYWDIEWGAEDRHEKSGIDEGWLITNTKFTSNATHYAECAGIHLLGWNYPHGAGLAEMIRTHGIYPVTVLTTLSKAEKMRLIENGAALCSDVAKHPNVLEDIGISGKKMERVAAESAVLCNIV